MKNQEFELETSPTARIVYLVDPNAQHLRSLKAGLLAHDFTVSVHQSSEDFLQGLDTRLPGCVIMEFRLGPTSGLDVMETLKTINPDMEVVFLTIDGPFTQSAQLACRMGAYNVLHKPCALERILHVAEMALRQSFANSRTAKGRSVVDLPTMPEVIA